MKHIRTFAILLALTAASAASTTESMDSMDMKSAGHAKQSPKPVAAEIRKIHLNTGEVTLKHGTIDSLGMGTVTMTFVVKDEALLKSFKEGQSVLAVFDMIGGWPTVMDLRGE